MLFRFRLDADLQKPKQRTSELFCLEVKPIVMRKPLLFIILLLASLIQAQPPMPFPQNAHWTVISWAHSGPGYGPYYWPLGSYGTTGDTTIQGLVHSKISFTAGSLFDPLQHTYHSAIREEEGKWFCVPENETSEYLLVDFSAGIGDTVVIDNPYWPEFMPLELIVSDIDETMIAGRRVWVMIRSNGEGFDHWIEGIGSTQGLMEFVNTGYWDAGTSLICFFEDEINTYQGNSEYNCISPLTIPLNERQEPAVSLRPNPASDRVMIDGVTAREAAVLDPRAGMVRLTYDLQEVQVHELPAGIYFIRIIDQENRIHISKLMVEH
jgi:hypothetical protein